MDFFYDEQVRRILLQFSRIFSSIKYRTGPDATGLYSVQDIPIMYGDPSWVVANLIKGNTDNTSMPVPMFSYYIESLVMSNERRKDPTFVGKSSNVVREFDEVTQTYGNGPGMRYDVEAYMPVPYDLTVKLDVWTPNTTTKLQIFEQIAIIFNPSIQLQSSSNVIDWSSIFEVFLQPDVIWTNRNIVSQEEQTKDVMTFKFLIPMWINPPAKVKRSALITEIVQNIFFDADISDARNAIGEYDPFRTCFDAGNPIQIITTVGNYQINVKRGATYDIVTLLNSKGQVDDTLSWADLFSKYGQVQQNITKLVLKLAPDIEDSSMDIIGDITIDPVNKNQLRYLVDTATIPGSTIQPITDIIDPIDMTPTNGMLPPTLPGQRYMLLSSNGTTGKIAFPYTALTSPWGAGLVAYYGDVIEFDGVSWFVAFNSQLSGSAGTRVLNIQNGTQYTYDGRDWIYTYYRNYLPGYWRIDGIL